MENADVLFLNFEGRPGTFNEAGQRNFCVLLDPEVAEDMAEDGWNVKQLKEYEGEPGDYYLQVEVKYRDRYGNDLRPPKIQIITSGGPTRLEERDVWQLDKVDIAKVDLIFNGKVREEDGKRKIKAYLQSYFCHINEDFLELKYAYLNDAQTPPALEMSQRAKDERDDIVDAELVEED